MLFVICLKQRATKGYVMAQQINDHSFWAGSKNKNSIFPEGVKMKHYEAGAGDGALNKYEDKEEDISRMQKESVKKMREHKARDTYRF